MARRPRQPTAAEMVRLRELFRAEMQALKDKAPDAAQHSAARKTYFDKIMFQKSVKGMSASELLEHLETERAGRAASPHSLPHLAEDDE